MQKEHPAKTLNPCCQHTLQVERERSTKAILNLSFSPSYEENPRAPYDQELTIELTKARCAKLAAGEVPTTS